MTCRLFLLLICLIFARFLQSMDISDISIRLQKLALIRNTLCHTITQNREILNIAFGFGFN